MEQCNKLCQAVDHLFGKIALLSQPKPIPVQAVNLEPKLVHSDTQEVNSPLVDLDDSKSWCEDDESFFNDEHVEIKGIYQDLCRGRGVYRIIYPAVAKLYRLHSEDFALLGSERSPDLIHRKQVDHKYTLNARAHTSTFHFILRAGNFGGLQ